MPLEIDDLNLSARISPVGADKLKLTLVFPCGMGYAERIQEVLAELIRQPRKPGDTPPEPGPFL